MKKTIPLLIVLINFLSLPAFSEPLQPNSSKTQNDSIIVHPIHHATLALTYNDKTVYVDPTGGASAFEGLDKPNIVLITDIHPDHLSIKTLKALDTKKAAFVVPKAVAKRLPKMYKKQLTILANGEKTKVKGISIRAIPMYNLPKSSDSYHVKGRGNGYVLTINGKNIYIAGDTEDIPEMRSLKNIYMAFIPMNLPYTMTVEQAADAVLDFEPSVVYPYHYKGSNIQKFKRLVQKGNATIEVRIRDWYPKS